MRVSVTLRGHVSNGKVKLAKKKLWDACLVSLEGKDVLVTIERESRQRSLKQNSYLHAVLNAVKDECGYLTMEETKFAVKYKLGYVYITETGRVYIAKTHLMNTVELNEFIEKLLAFANGDLGLNLPTAEEYKAMNPDKYYE